jgi:hypothetical protein
MPTDSKNPLVISPPKPADPTTEPTQDRQFFPCGRPEPSTATVTAETKAKTR